MFKFFKFCTGCSNTDPDELSTALDKATTDTEETSKKQLVEEEPKPQNRKELQESLNEYEFPSNVEKDEDKSPSTLSDTTQKGGITLAECRGFDLTNRN